VKEELDRSEGQIINHVTRQVGSSYFMSFLLPEDTSSITGSKEKFNLKRLSSEGFFSFSPRLKFE